ncbi:hypothetical protein Pcinc_021967 [Petrolisthes cinctipes]|uniref:Uncharacterized protein n=1 Tax=Petrolisthes cinctipes TaxID=88211 RepID=A0AAE1FGK3_PETCI|nr:hypothetical protein Pcinc_021967 [Petrolisthes cinctipes]
MDSRTGTKGVSRIRILSLGNPGVGKSCLIKRYCEKRFVGKYVPTVGIDYGSTTVDLDGRKVSRTLSSTPRAVHSSKMCVVSFTETCRGYYLPMTSLTDHRFIALDAWLAELRHNLGS